MRGISPLVAGILAVVISGLAWVQPGVAKTIKMVAVAGAPPIVTYVRATKGYFIPSPDPWYP